MGKFAFVVFVAVVWNIFDAKGQELEKNLPPENPQIAFKAGKTPDRIILTPSGNTGEILTVTWRTGTGTERQELQLSIGGREFDFYKRREVLIPSSEILVTLTGDTSVYHKVELKNVKESDKVVYRVGGGQYWSPWFDVVQNSDSQEITELIFLGDAQNDLYSLWSRVLYAANRKMPSPDLILHVGDLINHSQNDYEWAEWFYAGKSIFPSLPQVMVPGNHEYIKNPEGEKTGFTPFWNKQFNLPSNGPIGFEGRTFFVDKNQTRIICLDSNSGIEEQTEWLEMTIRENPLPWTIVMFHHPVISGAKERDNEGVLNLWKPILDRYQVDLVLQGHDHVYARGHQVDSGMGRWNEESGTVYVIAVAGRKMYPLEKRKWMDISAEGLPTYQLIRIEGNKLHYRSYSLDDEIFDEFEIIKKPEGINEFNDLIP